MLINLISRSVTTSIIHLKRINFNQNQYIKYQSPTPKVFSEVYVIKLVNKRNNLFVFLASLFLTKNFLIKYFEVSWYFNFIKSILQKVNIVYLLRLNHISFLIKNAFIFTKKHSKLFNDKRVSRVKRWLKKKYVNNFIFF